MTFSRLALLATLVLSTPTRADEPSPAVVASPETAVSPPTAAAPSPVPPGTVTPTQPPVQGSKVVLVEAGFRKKGVSPDLTLNFGVRVWDGDSVESRWWTARARAGVALYNEPSFLLFGLAGQLSALGSSSLGVEAQYIQMERGVWLQAGAYPIDSVDGVIVGGAAGYALFGLDYQRRVSGARQGDQTVVFSVLVPLGVIRVAMKKQVVAITVPDPATPP